MLNRIKRTYYTTEYFYFDSTSDLVDYLKNAKRCYDKDEIVVNNKYSTDKTTKDSIEWAGGVTYKQALDLLEYGDNELANSIEQVEISESPISEKIINKYFNDIQGFIPHIPNAIVGVPNSMINIKRTRVNGSSKILNIIIDKAVPGYVTTEDFMKCSKVILNTIDSLEEVGYRCNLYISDGAEFYDKDKVIWLVRLKSSDEPFNKYKCAFPLAHMAMSRRIFFRATECLTSGIADLSSYGSVLDEHETENLVKETFSLAEASCPNFKLIKLYSLLYEDKYDLVKDILR